MNSGALPLLLLGENARGHPGLGPPFLAPSLVDTRPPPGRRALALAP